MKSRFAKLVPYTILPIAIFSIQQYISLPIGNTTVWWLVHFLILFIFFWEARYSQVSREDNKSLQFVKIYLLWNVFSILRGVFVAESYWDYKGLISMGMTLLLPIIAYLSVNKERVQDILSFFVNYVIPFGLLLFPFMPIGAWGWYLFPIGFLMLFFPVLPMKGKIIVLVISLIAMFGDLGARSGVIKYGIPIVLVAGFYGIRHLVWGQKLMGYTRKLLVIAPFVFFILAVTDVFEVFKMDQYIKGNYVEVKKDSSGEVVEENLTADTRSFLYMEVIESARKYNYWLLGRTPARGNETIHFAGEMVRNTGRAERLRNEVGILNVFTWTGIIGVVLFFLVFNKASYMAIHKSKNTFVKLVGLFVAFRWVYAWVEDCNIFDINNFVIWMMIGICLSPSFRKMSDAELKLWVWGIFERKHYKKYRLFLRNDKYELIS